MTDWSKLLDYVGRQSYFDPMFKPFLIMLLATTMGCAYGVTSTKRQIPGGYDRVFVATFTNRTQEPGLEVYFTNAIIREVQRSNFAQITQKESSQVTIEGTISELKFERGGTVTSDKLTSLPPSAVLNTDYRILLDTHVVAKRNSDQKVLWQGVIKGEKSYFAPGVGWTGVNSVNPLYNHSARHQNISQLALDMMSEALDRMTENF